MRAIRPMLPRVAWVKMAGIPVAVERRLGDASILHHLCQPPELQDIADYEQALAQAIRQYVRPTDTVVVVGGGHGVTTTLAALAASEGSVICYEGDANGVEAVRRTAALNKVERRVTVHHAIVAQNIGVYGSDPSSTIVSPSELPKCDVLELDCEGAEISVIQNIKTLPRVIAVETHGFLGCSAKDVEAALSKRGYKVTDRGWAEPRLMDICRERDIRVLTGELHESS